MSNEKLLIATSNAGKIIEISQLLADDGHELIFLSDLETNTAEPAETGSSFSENARLKARYYAFLSQLPTLADDSGLSVLALDGFPGINSARWTAGSDSDRVSALLQLLEAEGLTEPLQRRAFFSCVVSLAMPAQEKTIDFEGVCWGTIGHVPLGKTGFGYDPIFIPDGKTMTMAQLGMSEKNIISARAIAFKHVSRWLQQH